jgi:hypothetical protein
VLWGPFEREDLARTEPDYWLEEPGDLLAVLELPGTGNRDSGIGC